MIHFVSSKTGITTHTSKDQPSTLLMSIIVAKEVSKVGDIIVEYVIGQHSKDPPSLNLARKLLSKKKKWHKVRGSGLGLG